MSRIDKSSVVVPVNVTAQVSGQDVSVKGPGGELSVSIPVPVTVELKDSEIVVNRPDDHHKNRSLHGLSRLLINNMVVDVTEGYTTKMEIFGVGYRIAKGGEDLGFSLSYSHLVPVEALKGITFDVDGTTKLPITGIDKQQVGQLIASIRRLRKDDPYKDKGIRYDGKWICRKTGKMSK